VSLRLLGLGTALPLATATGEQAAKAAQDLDDLTRGVRRMWSTASLTSKLGAKAAGRILFRKKPADGEFDVEAAIKSTEAAVANARKLVARMGQMLFEKIARLLGVTFDDELDLGQTVGD